MKSLNEAQSNAPFTIEVADVHDDAERYSDLGGQYGTVGEAINEFVYGDWAFKVYDCNHRLVCVGNTRQLI